MNEHFLAFIALGKTLASDAGLVWDFKTDAEGLAADNVGWNLTKAAGDVATSNRYLRDLGPDRKAFEYLASRDATASTPAIARKALSQPWRDLLQAAVAEQLLFQRNTVPHVTENIARPLRILAACVDYAPWELTADDVRRAVDVARAIQPSGQLATCLASQIKALFDGQHLCDAGPLFPALGTTTSFVNRRSRKARHRMSQDELREQLDDRKSSERLPSRKAFWELVRIVFTEQPKTFGDCLRFASCQILLMCGLRAGEVALIPSDWKRQRDYVDAKGRPAGEAGGISTSLMLRHFPEKQQEAESDSRVLREGVQPVPEMFRDLLTETLDRVATITRPLRDTLRLQCETGRLLPWYHEDALLPIREAYVRLTGNAFWLETDRGPLIERYRSGFDPDVLAEIQRHQAERYGRAKLDMSFYQFANRLRAIILDGKTDLRMRDKDGDEIDLSQRLLWDSVYLSVGELERHIKSFTPTKVSDLTAVPCEGGKSIAPWAFLFLFPKRSLSEERDDGICDISRYFSVNMPEPAFIHHALSDGSMRSSIFSRYGRSDEDRALSIDSHELRHLQTTELFRMGLADTIISKRFNRRSVAQSYEYDHRSLAESLADIDLPDDIEASLSPKAATVAKLVKSDRVTGPLVDAFRHIQMTKGESEAFDYLRVEADGFHSTPYGYCVNSFTVDPCPKHLECFAGCRHLAATDMPEHQSNLILLEGRLAQAMEAIQARQTKGLGWKNQLQHVDVRLRGVRALLSTPTGEHPFPNGKDLSAIHERGVLDE